MTCISGANSLSPALSSPPTNPGFYLYFFNAFFFISFLSSPTQLAIQSSALFPHGLSLAWLPTEHDFNSIPTSVFVIKTQCNPLLHSLAKISITSHKEFGTIFILPLIPSPCQSDHGHFSFELFTVSFIDTAHCDHFTSSVNILDNIIIQHITKFNRVHGNICGHCQGNCSPKQCWLPHPRIPISTFTLKFGFLPLKHDPSMNTLPACRHPNNTNVFYIDHVLPIPAYKQPSLPAATSDDFNMVPKPTKPVSTFSLKYFHS